MNASTSDLLGRAGPGSQRFIEMPRVVFLGRHRLEAYVLSAGSGRQREDGALMGPASLAPSAGAQQ